ncbi:MAG: hypothetical protein DBX63_02585 [Clostridia bacterium]|nr:MAG: hypothetical protein DBX63_02585 [Clostridia bacterium]
MAEASIPQYKYETMQKAPLGAFWRFLLRIHLQNELDRFTEKRQTAFFDSARQRRQKHKNGAVSGNALQHAL